MDEDTYDFFMCHTKQSTLWSSEAFVRALGSSLRKRGMTVFFDVEALQGREIADAVRFAGTARVLICVLDDKFPTMWCLREIEKAVQNEVPIITVMDQKEFNWREVGKDMWFNKTVEGESIPRSLIDKVFKMGTIMYSSHPNYETAAEERLLQLLGERRERRKAEEWTRPWPQGMSSAFPGSSAPAGSTPWPAAVLSQDFSQPSASAWPPSWPEPAAQSWPWTESNPSLAWSSSWPAAPAAESGFRDAWRPTAHVSVVADQPHLASDAAADPDEMPGTADEPEADHPAQATEELSEMEEWSGPPQVQTSREAGEMQQVNFILNFIRGLPSEAPCLELQFLQNLHAEAMGRGETSSLRAGEITSPGHRPPPHKDVPKLIRILAVDTEAMLETKEPVHVAAFALWALTSIQPFEEGNGLVARGAAFALLAGLRVATPRAMWHRYLARERQDQYVGALETASQELGTYQRSTSGRANCSEALTPLMDLLREVMQLHD